MFHKFMCVLYGLMRKLNIYVVSNGLTALVKSLNVFTTYIYVVSKELAFNQLYTTYIYVVSNGVASTFNTDQSSGNKFEFKCNFHFIMHYVYIRSQQRACAQQMIYYVYIRSRQRACAQQMIYYVYIRCRQYRNGYILRIYTFPAMGNLNF